MITAAAVVALLSACRGTAGTPVPAGYPLNACAPGDPAVKPRGSHLLVPGEVKVGWQVWHNETPDSFACGAQSVDGAKAAIRLSDMADDLPIAWAATFRRAVPLQAPEPEPPRAELFLITSDDWVLIERMEVPLEHQYGAMGYLSPGLKVGTYRMIILSAADEFLAEAVFKVVE